MSQVQPCWSHLMFMLLLVHREVINVKESHVFKRKRSRFVIIIQEVLMPREAINTLNLLGEG